MNRRTWMLQVLLLGILVFLVFLVVLLPKKRELNDEIAMLDIGQGDSFLIQTKEGRQMLVDGGKDASVLTQLSKTMPLGDRTIDVVLATHPDADHIGGLHYVLERYKVGLFLTSDVMADTSTFAELYQTIRKKHVPAYYVRKGMFVSLNDHTQFSILFPDRDTTNWETNAASVVGRLDMGTKSALFTGDSPIQIEQYLVRTDPKDIDVDILKLGHHGSKTSSSLEFLKATSPSLALISAGKNNSYGHPHQEVLDRLKELGIPWVNTAEIGTYLLTN